VKTRKQGGHGRTLVTAEVREQLERVSSEKSRCAGRRNTGRRLVPCELSGVKEENGDRRRKSKYDSLGCSHPPDSTATTRPLGNAGPARVLSVLSVQCLQQHSPTL
jgi:hypothetical protein